MVSATQWLKKCEVGKGGEREVDKSSHVVKSTHTHTLRETKHHVEFTQCLCLGHMA